ncbi:MAG: FtsX-like permease family protein, partial [Candidatus Marinimicrobia bacterium]|nr:FtsX-like permease family protein [Candidatus Neomarinimicrobiota bacterium]
KEGISGLWRAKFPSFVAIITIAIAMTLLGITYITGTEIYNIVDRMKTQLQIEIFLLPGATETEMSRIENTLNSEELVAGFEFVSKDEAAERFSAEFGEDIYEVLEVNPLPASYTVQISSNYQTFSEISSFAQSIENLGGIDEVKYRQNFLQLLERYYRAAAVIGGVIMAIILGAAVLLVGNTIKLSIFAKREVIRIMRLVGATNRFIRTPFIIEGIIQGLLGSLGALFILYVLVSGTNYFLTGILNAGLAMDPVLILGVLVIGIFFGFIGSTRSIRMFLSDRRFS